jgi:hypothetical protein
MRTPTFVQTSVGSGFISTIKTTSTTTTRSRFRAARAGQLRIRALLTRVDEGGVNHGNTKSEERAAQAIETMKHENAHAIETMKHENAVIIEVLKHGNDQQLDSRLERLVHLGFLQSKWVGR